MTSFNLMTTATLLLGLAMPATAQEGGILSLGGSVTEIVVALGAQDRLIARDSTSTYPAEVLSLPDVGYLRALSAEGVLSLSPKLIIAEADAGPPEAVDVIKSAGVPYVAVSGGPNAAGIVAKITEVADALSLQDKGAELAASVQTGLDEAAARAAEVAQKKRVLFVLSLQGGRVMAAGTNSSADGIIALAGGVNALEGFEGYKPVTDEAILAAKPDVILMMDREGDLAMSNDDVMAQPALAQTPAAQTGAIVRMDGMLLLGFGPRTPQAAAELYTAIYGTKE